MAYKLVVKTLIFSIIAVSNLLYAEDGLNSTLDPLVQCQEQTITNTILCGEISGRIKSLYYSTYNAYFVEDLNQDTASIGGFIKYQTQPIEGLSSGISYASQRRLDDKKDFKDEVTELAAEKDGLAELYLKYEKENLKIKIGQQDLDLPFVGNYDWRIMPVLYRAVDFKYLNDDNFIRLSKIDRFKSYADDQFTQSSRYSADLKTNGMWSIGFGKNFEYENKQLTTQAWYQAYDDYTNITYLEGHLKFKNIRYTPDFGVQLMYGRDQGKALAGEIHHTGIGFLLGLSVIEDLTLTTAYNYIKPKADTYLNGALFAPYMIYTASGPYFAQPFFTSTQDLGSGHAASIALEGNWTDNFYVGARYSFMNLKETAEVKALNQSEYVLYGIYSFSGALKGWSISNFMGLATSPRSSKTFLQNRFGLSYEF